jgi:hypothetical protein
VYLFVISVCIACLTLVQINKKTGNWIGGSSTINYVVSTKVCDFVLLSILVAIQLSKKLRRLAKYIKNNRNAIHTLMSQILTSWRDNKNHYWMLNALLFVSSSGDFHCYIREWALESTCNTSPKVMGIILQLLVRWGFDRLIIMR